jgi:hypothetical protein
MAETCRPFEQKPLLTPYYRKESCDLTVINKAYIVCDHLKPLSMEALLTFSIYYSSTCSEVETTLEAD